MGGNEHFNQYLPQTLLVIFVSGNLDSIIYKQSTYFLKLAICSILLGVSQAAYAQDLYWEDFELPSGTTVDNGPTAWSRDISNAGPGPNGYFETRTNAGVTLFEGVDLNGEAVWLSEVLDISTLPSVTSSVDIAEFGTMEGSDFLRLYYRLDGGSEVIFGDFKNDFGSSFQSIFSPSLSGSSLQIIIRVKNNETSEVHVFDNVKVFDSSFGGPTLYSRANRDWNNQNAWSTEGLGGSSCHCTPDINSNVIIGSSHTIGLNGDAEVRNLTIQGTGALNTNSQHDLTISGDFNITSSNSDPLIIGFQTVTFTGSSEQNIALAGESLFNIIVNKTGNNVNLTGPVNLFGQLTIQSETEFASDGHLKLISTSDGTSGNASIGSIPNGGSVSGNVIVQRYISGEGNIWRYISSPITNATVADWQDDFPITGTFDDPSAGPGINSLEPSLYQYGESGSGDNLQLGWSAFPTSGTAANNLLIPGVGYTALMLDGANPTTVGVTGPINQGNFNFSVSFAGSGWNLLGNPYPATIDWSTGAGWSNNNLANAIYIRNNENGNSNSVVASYVDGIGTNGGTGLVSTGQSFWVQAIGANPSLQINERAKSSSTGAFFRKARATNHFRITLNTQKQFDETVIRFDNQATRAYDSEMDAKKFSNGGINLSTFIETEGSMAINSLPEVFCREEIFLKLSRTKPGSYNILFTELAGFNLPYSFELVDNYIDTTMVVVDSTSYEFNITKNSASFNDRFRLVIKPKLIAISPEIELKSSCTSTKQVVIKNSNREISYALYQGDSLLHALPGNGENLGLTFLYNLSVNDEPISLSLESLHCQEILYQEEIDMPQLLAPRIKTVIPGLSCGAGSVYIKAEAANGENLDVSYNWYQDESSELPIAVTQIGEFVTPKLAKSRTYFVSVSNQSGCESDRKEVFAQVEILGKINISHREGSDTLWSNYETGNQWYFEGYMIPDENRSFLIIDEPGTYGLQATIRQCGLFKELEILPIDLTSSSSQLLVFPNPVKDYLGINFKSKQNQELNAFIYDLQGKLRFSTPLEVFQGKARINFSHIEPGMYTLKLIGDDKKYSVKILRSP